MPEARSSQLNRRRLSTVGRILGGIAIIIVVLLAVGPFLIPVRPLEGLASTEQAATNDSEFVTIPFDGTDGITLHYIADSVDASDETPAFVLLHGSLFNSFTWNEVMDRFSEHGRAIAYDQIPYGLSEKLVTGEWSGENPYTPEAAVEQLFLFLDEMGLDRVILVGHSYGGSLAAQAALAQPDRIEAVIFVDPAVYVQEEMPGWLLELPQVRHIGPLFARMLVQNDAFLRQMYLNPEPLVTERLPLTRIQTQVEDWDVAMWEYLRAWSVDVDDLAARIPELQQPALVISGDSDAIVPITDSQRLASDLPDSDLVTLPSCGHVPQEECPDAFEDAVEAWLIQRNLLE